MLILIRQSYFNHPTLISKSWVSFGRLLISSCTLEAKYVDILFRYQCVIVDVGLTNVSHTFDI